MLANQRELYKRFIKLARRWPEQPNRSHPLAKVLIQQIRSQFRNTNDMQHAQRELAALEKLSQDSWGIHQDSRLKLFLPPKQRYSLLDKAGQEALKSTTLSPFRYITDFFRKK